MREQMWCIGCYDVSPGRDEALGVCLVVDTELAFIAMCLSAACGHYDMVEIIGNAGKNRVSLQCRPTFTLECTEINGHS